jgi:DtxR family Mn-dependent transcriptional regulator
MPSSTVENYVKRIFLEQQGTSSTPLPMGRVATSMGVTPGTATTMVQALAQAGLVRYEKRGGVRLTRNGQKLALHVLRRHRLVELFLVRVLGLDWSEVHAEAEELEHAVSEKVLDRIDRLLGHPRVDPHGDPIPSRNGIMAPASLRTLIDVKAGVGVVVTRVVDQDSDFLRFAEASGILPGVRLRVVEHNLPADAVTVHPHGRSPVTLGATAASKILVERTPHARGGRRRGGLRTTG